MKFTQHIIVYAEDPAALADLLHDWHGAETGVAPGYIGARLMAFREKPGRYVIEADFDSWEAAQKNNDRPETHQWSDSLRSLITQEPKYENLDVIATFGV